MTLREQPPVYRAVAAVLRPVMAAVTRRDWRGAEHLPATGGLVVCSNHLSEVDPLTLAHFLVDNGRPPTFLGKESLFRVPVVGAVLRAAGQIPVHRDSGDAAAAFASAVEAVRDGACIAIYPEATLTRDAHLWPMVGKTGAARLSLSTGAPVVPVAQWGPEQVLAPYGRVPHLLPPRTVHVVAGPPVDLEDLRGRPVDQQVLLEATARIMADVTRLLEGLRGEPAPLRPYDPREHAQPRTGRPFAAVRRAQLRTVQQARRGLGGLRALRRNGSGRRP